MNYFAPARLVLSVTLLAQLLSFGLATAAPGRPNVLLILSDDQRPDTIHALGNANIETPHLDDLATTGTAFTRAVCANPICTPSRAEIMSGACSFHNGVLDFGQTIKPGMKLWAQAMSDGGYQTWYVGKWHNDGRPSGRGYRTAAGLFAGGGARWARDQTDWKGFPATGYQGWVFQSDSGQMFPEQSVGLTTRTSRQIADAAIGMLQSWTRQQPFFLHVNFTAPHDPLLLPPELATKYDPQQIPLPANFLPRHPFDHGNLHGRDEEVFSWPRTAEQVRGELACYYAVITQMDAEIGRILAMLDETGQAANTVVIFTSDHGLAIGSHGLRGKQNMYEHTIGVPLLMRGPGIAQGRRLATQVYLRDLYPTVMELAGLPIPSTVEGRSLLPLLAGGSKALYQEVFGYFRNFQRMVRTDRWKLIYYPQINRSQLFDLQLDPDERHDVSAEPGNCEVLSDLRNRLLANQKAHGDPLVAETPTKTPSPASKP
jgi:arylsulfatase A-like enzyme